MLLRVQAETTKKLNQAIDPAAQVVTESTAVHIPAVAAMDEDSTRETVAMLRRFHLGDPDAGSRFELPDVGHWPALLHAYRHLRRFRYEYPLLLMPAASDQKEMVVSLEDFLSCAIRAFAGAESDARILKDNLAWLDNWIRDHLTGHEQPEPAIPLVQKAANALLAQLKLAGDNLAALSDDLEQLVAQVPFGSDFLALNANAPFYLFQHVTYCHRAETRRTFEARVEQGIYGLKQLLAVEEEKSRDSDSSRAGPGAQFLDAENFSSMVSHRHRGTVAMPKARRQRIEQSLQQLKKFSEIPTELLRMIVRHGSVSNLSDQKFNAMISEDPCTEALRQYDEQAELWSGLFSALRIAELEVENQYDASVHDSWFQSFDGDAFSADELLMLPPIVAVETTTHAAGTHMPSFSRVLNSGKPIQILMTVSAHGNPEQAGEDPLHGFRMELAYIGIGHREAVVNQASTARMQSMVNGFATALNSTRPGLHLLHTGFTQAQPLHPWLLANAALESRAHPSIRFNPAFLGGGQVDFDDNPCNEDDWVGGEFSYLDADEQMIETELKFTFADYCLLKPDLRGHFRLVPQDCDSADFVAVDEFLNSSDSNGRKVPFVWSVDDRGVLGKLVISRELAFACRDRLGFWRNLQSMAGIHNYYVDQAIQQVRQQEQSRASAEIEAVQLAHLDELEKLRDSAAEEIMGRLTEVLMGLDLSDSALGLVGDGRKTIPSVSPNADLLVEADVEGIEPEKADEPDVDEEEISFNEPWIDSMMCTSCDDCLAINKVMFTYNQDKQAIIKDISAGTYAQLVKAAELCPAKCIHPGKPLDPDEPDLEELISRAEPFN